ncbi:hypothetical protein Pfo_005629 [Paulownia fortunei]|nr:hypothetical protein Pfo_005629 [Paulownia fortunei]
MGKFGWYCGPPGYITVDLILIIDLNAAKRRDPIVFRTHCILSTTSIPMLTATTTVIELTRLQLPLLLTASEEHVLSERIQALEEELTERCGGQPTFSQRPDEASNIRLVISIAKNYQGAGMNLQDSVQERRRGLVRGAEKFDASKGFMFSACSLVDKASSSDVPFSDKSTILSRSVIGELSILPYNGFYIEVMPTYRLEAAREQLYAENGRHPENEEVVAEATGLSTKQLSAALLTPEASRSPYEKIGINQNLKSSILKQKHQIRGFARQTMYETGLGKGARHSESPGDKQVIK